MRREHARVARRLVGDQLAEGERAIRNREVFSGRLGDLQEYSDGRSALVELAGRVQEARSPAEGDGTPGTGRENVAQFGEVRMRDTVHVGLDGQVTVVGEMREQLVDHGLQVARAIDHVGGAANLDSVFGEGRRDRRGGLIQQRASGDLRRLDVGLVERVDAEQATRDRDRILPGQQLRARGSP